MRNKNTYAAIGYLVTKFGLPLARRHGKRASRRHAARVAGGTADAARRHPARTSIAVGALVGAVGWLLTRDRSGSRHGGGHDPHA